MATIELEDAFADDSLEMDEVGDKFRVAADLQARIVATGPITSAPPSQITVTPAATGAATETARADHVHDVAVATPTALTVGGSNAAGTSTALARADHKHALPAFGSPVAEAIGSAAADGVASTFVRSDHVHAMPAAGAPAALAIGSAQSAGAAATLARSDHVHAMPGLATTSVDGFMPAASAVKLAGLPTTVVSVPGGATAAVAGCIYLVDNSSNTATVTLPPAAANSGKQILIKHSKGGSPNHLFIAAAASETIDGRSTIEIDVLYQWVGLISDGTAWFTYADSLVANRLQIASTTTFQTLGAIDVNQLMRRNAGDIISGGPVTMDNAGNLANVNTINGQVPLGLNLTDPTTIYNVAASAGASPAASRSDHQHPVSIAVPVALVPGGANALGGGSALALAQHIHALPAFGSAAGTFCEGNDARLSAALVNPAVNGFRLAPTADDSIPADGTFSTIYLAPVESDLIALYTAGAWALRSASGLSYTLAARTTDRPFDLFAWWDTSGTPAVKLEAADWSATPNTRATALVKQNGVWVKSGDPTRRYLGTVRPRSATTYRVQRNSQIETASAGIDYWNVSNRRQAAVVIGASTNFWEFLGSSFRAANNQANAHMDIVAGLAGDPVLVQLLASANTAIASPNVYPSVAIGINSTTVTASRHTSEGISRPGTGTPYDSASFQAHLGTAAPLGVTAFYWLEYSSAASSTFFYGNNSGPSMVSGMTGIISY